VQQGKPDKLAMLQWRNSKYRYHTVPFKHLIDVYFED
jgi:hypothetical protein